MKNQSREDETILQIEIETVETESKRNYTYICMMYVGGGGAYTTSTYKWFFVFSISSQFIRFLSSSFYADSNMKN